jgi:hypothetical protein
MDLIRRARLPVPLFNAQLYDPAGSLIAVADAWWPQSGVAAEADSREEPAGSAPRPEPARSRTGRCPLDSPA